MEKEQKLLIVRFILSALLFGLSFISALKNIGTLIMCLVSFLIISFDVIYQSFKDLFSGEIFNEKFLMLLASIGAFAIAEYHEAVVVMFLYQLGEFLQDLSVDKAKDSIKNLMDIRPDFANLIQSDDSILKVDPQKVEVGSKIIVYAGEKIPLDGEIIQGETSIDTSSLTGESLPKDVFVGDMVACGTINLTGTITVEVTKEYANSSVYKIIEMVEKSEEKQAKTDKFISKFAKIYTPVVVCLAVILAVLPPLAFGLAWKTWINRALSFLVISCPCALVISIPLTFFAGIGGASRQGILIKGANHIETLAKVNVIGLDKTGTLTKGNFVVTKIFAENGDEDSLLKLCATAETGQTHPIAKSIMLLSEQKFGKLKQDVLEQTVLPGLGIKATINKSTIYVGNEKLMQSLGLKIPETNEIGTIVYVAEKTLLGFIVLEDEVHENSAMLCEELAKLKVNRIAMITGDKFSVAENVAGKVNIKEFHAELLPEDKVKVLEELKLSGVTAYVGDGINDAPVLKQADIGIAMGKIGSDLAINSADVVLMDCNPKKIADAIKISKRTMRLAKQNIVFTIAFKIFMLVLGATGIASMWLAIFADVGVSLLAVLNAMRAFKKIK